ncbi:MAG: fructosamine kinase family protein [Longimicrobiaceae bacterium]
MLPEAVRAGVEGALGPILRIRPVAGGCISETFRVETGDGPVFLKHHPEAPAGMFAAEADGLRALWEAAGDALCIPAVLALDGAGDGASWIALEWLEPGTRGPGFGERLGRGLAALHRNGVGGWGWERMNFIGALPQPNEPAAAWAEFWRDRRLAPQLAMARAAGRDAGPGREWDRLLDWLPELLAPAEEDGPSLLHGDLWSGNVLSAVGEPALIDPAVYRGHREADLAMAELFGGFDARFHAAYREAWPLLPGYAEVRRPIYQLYYLLVHVNLFGGGYGAQAAAVLRRAVAGG